VLARRAGELDLTSRQRELLRLVAAGLTNGQIGHQLLIAQGTVRKHLENIYAQLEVTNRTAAVARANVLEPQWASRG
jgi:ATP/maltotriose-dependent transcriptional regulator MalT